MADEQVGFITRRVEREFGNKAEQVSPERRRGAIVAASSA